MLKKSRLIVALSLIVQAVTLSALFLLLCAKKKSIAYAILAIAAIEGSAGAYLLYQLKGEHGDFNPEEYIDEDFDLEDSMLSSALSHLEEDEPQAQEIPRDENVSEEEFKNH